MRLPRRRTVLALVGNDLRALLRSPRTLLMSVVLPLAIWPLVFLVTQWVQDERDHRLDSTIFEYALTGSQSDEAADLLSGLPDEAPLLNRLRDIPDDRLLEALNESEISFWIVATETDSGTLDLRIHHRGDRETSREAVGRLSRALETELEQQRSRVLEARDFPLALDDIGRVEEADLASDEASSGLELGRFLTLTVTMMLLIGGSVVASDCLAGEKERGTLETLLTTAATRLEIVTAKHQVILLVGVTTLVLQLLDLLVFLGLGLIELPAGMVAVFTPGLGVLLFFLYLPVASLVASLLLMTSAWAKSYKEAQLYYLPVFLLTLIPALAPLMPTISLRSGVLVVPIAGLAVAAKELMSGNFDGPPIAATWAVTLAAAGLAAWQSVQLLHREALVTPGGDEGEGIDAGGRRSFDADVLRWCAVLWAIVLLAATFTGTDATLVGQLSFNFGLLTVGGFLILKIYRLPWRQALAIRAPRPAAWLAVAIGAPSGLLLSNSLFHLTQRFAPVPDAALEAFSESLIPKDMPAWLLLLLVAALPGLVEELFFRGILLHGLRKRSRWRAALIVAVVFGIYHVSLFRLLPTAALGFVLAWVTLLSASIWPAVVWHTLNNGLALHFDPGARATEPLWIAAALVGLTLSILVLRFSAGRRRES